MDASNNVWDAPEGRPIWKKIPVRLGVTVVLLVLLTVTALAVVFTGPVAQEIGDIIGLGGTFVGVWGIAKWPILLLIVSFMISLLYWACPNVKQPGFPWVTPGGLLAVVLWIAASALFALYVANFSSYNKTYGSLGGVIVFLTWLWITNIIILLGAEFNSEMERSKAIQGGHPPDKEPFLPLRDEPKRTSAVTTGESPQRSSVDDRPLLRRIARGAEAASPRSPAHAERGRRHLRGRCRRRRAWPAETFAVVAARARHRLTGTRPTASRVRAAPRQRSGARCRAHAAGQRAELAATPDSARADAWPIAASAVRARRRS